MPNTTGTESPRYSKGELHRLILDSKERGEPSWVIRSLIEQMDDIAE